LGREFRSLLFYPNVPCPFFFLFPTACAVPPPPAPLATFFPDFSCCLFFQHLPVEPSVTTSPPRNEILFKLGVPSPSLVPKGTLPPLSQVAPPPPSIFGLGNPPHFSRVLFISLLTSAPRSPVSFFQGSESTPIISQVLDVRLRLPTLSVETSHEKLLPLFPFPSSPIIHLKLPFFSPPYVFCVSLFG